MTIILSGIAIFGLIYSFTLQGKNQKIITLLMSCSIFLNLIDNVYIDVFAKLLLLVAAVLSVIYSIRTSQIIIITRTFIGVSGVLFLLHILTTILPVGEIKQLHIAMLAPIILFLLHFIKFKKKIPKEFGFMIIWFTLSLYEFIGYYL